MSGNRFSRTIGRVVRRLSEWAWRDYHEWSVRAAAESCAALMERDEALFMARDALMANKRHLESMGRHAAAGTHEALDEIDNVLSPPNPAFTGPSPQRGRVRCEALLAESSRSNDNG